MKYRFFSVPAATPEEAQEAVNRFCAAHRVVSVDKQFVQHAERSYWALCVCSLEQETGPVLQRKGKVDYREVFNDQDFALFVRLRNLRKTLSEQEGVPAYALFTNEQLAAMVQQRVTSRAALGAIDGVGTARIEKYGAAFLEVLQPQANGAADPGAAATSETNVP
jgi:superfamily II DNA helicase RecQ